MGGVVTGHIVDAELHLCAAQDFMVWLLAQVVEQFASVDVSILFLGVDAVAGFDNDYFGLIQQFASFGNMSRAAARIQSRCQSAGHQSSGRHICQLIP